MIKFLIIIGIIFLVILLIIKIVRKKIENIIQQFVPKQQSQSKDTIANEVLYEKDDVVVLKGEADRKNQTEE
ncbi:hypothetical protein D9V86_03320 [Bacteroidetes/Chlorobi group bacterium ChocPot_Mid]|jgi:uncharacterized protein YpmB|nr:MAG: hypothetical protein D9V86_03320 [Bacteroidetes/Chlorobi group bacterium ChocPot_Mid]